MKFSPEQKLRSRGLFRKAGMCVAAVAMASFMVVPAASANSSGAGVVTSNGYGMNPSKEIGTNTVPSAEKGDTAYVLTSLYNSEGQRYITGCCGGSGTASCDYLDVVGIDNIGTTGYNWGTKINVNPNHFAWNDAVSDESTCTQLNGQADSASAGIGYVKSAWCGVMTYATVEKYLPDVLASTASSTYENIVKMIHADGYTEVDKNTLYTKSQSSGGPGGGQATYTVDENGTYVMVGTDYVELSSITTWYSVDADGVYSVDVDGTYVMTTPKYANYNPQIMSYNTDDRLTITTLSDALWTEAVAAESVEGYGTTAITRYGDPTDIAQEFEGFVKALQWYILSKHESKGLKTVAYVTNYADGQITCSATNPKRSKDGKRAIRNLEGFEQITNNIALTGSNFTLTGTESEDDVNTYTADNLSDFAKVDVIFTASNFDATALQSALDAAGYTCKIVPVSLAIGNQGFGLIRNLIEYMGYLYPNDVQLSYMLKFFWGHFGHVKDQYIDDVMVDQDSNKLLPTGDAQVDLDTTGYSDHYIYARMAAGEAYYQANMDNAESNCSNYCLQAQNTVAENQYQFGVFTQLANNTKAAQTLKFTAAGTSAKTYKANKKTKKLGYARTFFAKVTGAKTKVTYSRYFVTKAAKAYVTVNASTGKVTVKKGLKKGTYKLRVKAYAASSSDYKSATVVSKYITIKVK